MQVAVIGAGVVGLSTALVAQQRGWAVPLYIDRLPLRTTSVKAAASFKPHAVDYTAQTQRLLEDSWVACEKILVQAGAAAGVRKHIHWEAGSAPRPRVDYLSVMQQGAYPGTPRGARGIRFWLAISDFFY